METLLLATIVSDSMIFLLTGMTSIIMIWEAWKRFRHVTLLGAAFILFSIGLVLQVMSELTWHWIQAPYSQEQSFFRSWILFFFSLGFALLWLHHVLTRYFRTPLPILIYIIGVSSAIVMCLVLQAFIYPNQEPCQVAMITLTMFLGVPTVAYILYLNVGEMKVFQQNTLLTLESIGYMGWITGLLGKSLFIFQTVRIVNELFWNGISGIGVLVLSLLYLKERPFLHKIQRKVMCMACYLDSGVPFFQIPLYYHYLIEDVNDDYLSITGGFISAIDSIFRHLLQQEVIMGNHVGKQYCLYLLRNEVKKVGLVFLADEIPYYLHLAAKHFLNALPEKFVKNLHESILDHKSINETILPLFESCFPYLALTAEQTVSE